MDPTPNQYRPHAPGTQAGRMRIRQSSMVGNVKRQVRKWFTLERMRDFGTTLALVVPLTLLIWVWAEREQTVKSEEMLFIIDARSFDPTKIMSIVRDGLTSVAVTIELTGPRSGLEAIKESVKNPANSRLTIVVTEGFEPASEPYTIPIESRLNLQKLFESNGVSVKSCKPATAQILVDRLVHRDLEIKLPVDLASRIASIEVLPRTVGVHGPERVITELEAAGKLVAELDLGAQSEIFNARPGITLTLGMERIRPIIAPGVSLDASQIKGGKLQMSQEERGVIRSMAVFVAKPAGLEAQYSVTVSPLTLTNIQVIGPIEILKKLEADEYQPKPFALLTIAREDIGKTHDRMPTFQQLPSGVRVDMQSVSPLHFSVTGADAANDLKVIP